MDSPALRSITSVGVFLRPKTPSLKELSLQIARRLEESGISVLFEAQSAEMIGVRGELLSDMLKAVDLLLAIGGDGTLLSAVRQSYTYDLPVLGLNMGRLGFLTDLQQGEMEGFIPKLKRGEYRLESRLMLEGELLKEGKEEQRLFALNEIIITRSEVSGMTRVKAWVEGEYCNTYYGDGLIIATPTGSTAYNISAGGPVVYPYARNILLTPICAHSITQRPLILPADFEIRLELDEAHEAKIIVDGQEILGFALGDSLKLRAAKKPAKLLHRLESSYFEVLRKKFSWGDA